MKIGTTEKLKFKSLQRRMRLPLWQAVGLLETLWKVTCRNAPAGDIGRLSNDEIAAALEWEGSADELVSNLVETKWLDTDPTHRLLVHDWELECESWLRGNFERNKKQFAKPTKIQATEPSTSMHESTKQTTEQPASKPPIPYHPIPYPSSSSPITTVDVPESRVSDPESHGWAAVVAELNAEGVQIADDAVGSARSRGCLPSEAMEVIEQWRDWRPAFGVGLLVSKIRGLQPGAKISWPDPPAGCVRKSSRAKAAAAKRANPENSKALKELQNDARAEKELLEQRFGPQLDAMSKENARDFLLLRQSELAHTRITEWPLPRGMFRTAILTELEQSAKQSVSVLESQAP